MRESASPRDCEDWNVWISYFVGRWHNLDNALFMKEMSHFVPAFSVALQATLVFKWMKEGNHGWGKNVSDLIMKFSSKFDTSRISQDGQDRPERSEICENEQNSVILWVCTQLAFWRAALGECYFLSMSCPPSQMCAKQKSCYSCSI